MILSSYKPQTNWIFLGTLSDSQFDLWLIMADDGLDGVLFFLCPHDVISSQVKAVVPLDAKHQGTLNTV